MRLLRAVLFGTLCLLASAGVANAQPTASREALVLVPHNVGFADPTPACPGGIITFDVAARDGSALGTGTSCVQSAQSECEAAPVAGCRQTVDTIVRIYLADGALRFRTRLREIWVSDSKLVQIADGTLTRALGRYAESEGRLRGAGTITFTPTAIETDIVWVVTLTDDAE